LVRRKEVRRGPERNGPRSGEAGRGRERLSLGLIRLIAGGIRGVALQYALDTEREQLVFLYFFSFLFFV
jgi:hypothetical protein